MSRRKDPATQNEDSYEELVESIAAIKDKMSLLIAVCDDSILRDRVIQGYETELEPLGFSAYRLKLARGEPSLRAAIAKVVQKESYLSQGGIAVLTVMGIEKLRYLEGFDGDRTEQDKFFGYLQWTREALPHFKYPIVIWLTNEIKNKVIKYAPDFWSWRGGVLRFSPQIIITNEDNRTNFYIQMGKEYANRLESGEFADYKTEQSLAVEYLQEALALPIKSDPNVNLADNLNDLANLYHDMGLYSEAEPLLQQALELRKHLLGAEHIDVASSLNNLAFLYKSQGRYGEAEPLLQKALELIKSLLGDDHSDMAPSLNNLAEIYKYQGRYSEAEPLYLQVLELRTRLLGADHPDVAPSLNNLAEVYKDQGRYAEAEPLYLQALQLRQSIQGKNHSNLAKHLNDFLAALYRYQAGTAYSGTAYSSVLEDICMQILEFRKHILGEDHPEVATILNNLAELYKSKGQYAEAETFYLQALQLRQSLLRKNHPNVATSLNNLAALYQSQGRYKEAETLYVQAWQLSMKVLGKDHPQIATINKNLAALRSEITASKS